MTLAHKLLEKDVRLYWLNGEVGFSPMENISTDLKSELVHLAERMVEHGLEAQSQLISIADQKGYSPKKWEALTKKLRNLAVPLEEADGFQLLLAWSGAHLSLANEKSRLRHKGITRIEQASANASVTWISTKLIPSLQGRLVGVSILNSELHLAIMRMK